MLDEIKAILTDLCADEDVPMNCVYYGMCIEKKLEQWNFFTFRRLSAGLTNSQRSTVDRYEICIVHDDYIPEGYHLTVADTVLSALPGASRDSDFEFATALKTDSAALVEICRFEIKKTSKVKVD